MQSGKQGVLPLMRPVEKMMLAIIKGEVKQGNAVGIKDEVFVAKMKVSLSTVKRARKRLVAAGVFRADFARGRSMFYKYGSE